MLFLCWSHVTRVGVNTCLNDACFLSTIFSSPSSLFYECLHAVYPVRIATLRRGVRGPGGGIPAEVSARVPEPPVRRQRAEK